MRVRTVARFQGYDLVFCTSLPFLLVVASAARLTGWRWRPWPPGRHGYRSVVRETFDRARQVAQLSCAGL